MNTDNIMFVLQSGFNKGSDDAFVMMPKQETDLADFSNVGLTGRWMYRIDGTPIQPPPSCDD